MYVEWWMALVFLAWWLLSVMDLSKKAKVTAFAEGVQKGTDSTLKILEKEGIIQMNGDEIMPGKKFKKS
jgi:hypothetical protein